MMISLECLGKLSLQVKKQFADIFRSCHKNIKLTVVFKSANRILKSIDSKVLYKYTYDTCHSVCIGKTKLHLLGRQDENLGTSIVADKALKYNEKDDVAIRKNCYQHQHNSLLDNFQVLGNASFTVKRVFIDSQNEAIFKYCQRINTLLCLIVGGIILQILGKKPSSSFNYCKRMT